MSDCNEIAQLLGEGEEDNRELNNTAAQQQRQSIPNPQQNSNMQQQADGAQACAKAPILWKPPLPPGNTASASASTPTILSAQPSEGEQNTNIFQQVGTRANASTTPRPQVLEGDGGLISTQALRPTDILCVRGYADNRPANISYRELIRSRKPEYVAAKKGDKIKISGSIVNEVRSKGGRFLKKVPGKDGEEDKWKEIGDVKAVEKVGQALREKGRKPSTPNVSSNLQQQDGARDHHYSQPSVSGISSPLPGDMPIYHSLNSGNDLQYESSSVVNNNNAAGRKNNSKRVGNGKSQGEPNVKKKKKSSLYTGIKATSSKKWRSHISHCNKGKDLGSYPLQADAALAYDVAIKLLRGSSTKANFTSLEAYERAKKDELAIRTGLSSDDAMSSEAINAKVTKLVNDTWPAAPLANTVFNSESTVPPRKTPTAAGVQRPVPISATPISKTTFGSNNNGSMPTVLLDHQLQTATSDGLSASESRTKTSSPTQVQAPTPCELRVQDFTDKGASETSQPRTSGDISTAESEASVCTSNNTESFDDKLDKATECLSLKKLMEESHAAQRVHDHKSVDESKMMVVDNIIKAHKEESIKYSMSELQAKEGKLKNSIKALEDWQANSQSLGLATAESLAKSSSKIEENRTDLATIESQIQDQTKIIQELKDKCFRKFNENITRLDGYLEKRKEAWKTVAKHLKMDEKDVPITRDTTWKDMWYGYWKYP